MLNIPFPFNQKQHIFDFKVKVNFQNGNVSLTAPQIVTPPANFSNQQMYNQYSQQSRNPISFSQNQLNTHVQKLPILQNPIPIQSPYGQINNPQHQLGIPQVFTKGQQIQLVNSSYTSLKEDNNQSMSNTSMQMIQCVLCQKSFTSHELDQHLQLHKNRFNNKNNTSIQKGSISNYAMTQNSVNGLNDSVLSDQKNNLSFQNQSYQSQLNTPNLYTQIKSNTNKNSSFVTSSNKNNNTNINNEFNAIVRRNQSQRIQNLQNANKINQSISGNKNTQQQQQQQQQQNDSFPQLGRIQNPILALKKAQQQQREQSSISSLTQSHSTTSQPNQSLNYSNSDGQQSTTRFNNPIIGINPHEQIPQFYNPQSNNSSFGNLPGNNVIGPSFYQNSSHQSVNNNAPFFKGVNRMAYNDGSLHSQVPLMTNPIVAQNNNQSYHSNQSNSVNNLSLNSQQQQQHSNQFINQQPLVMNFPNNNQSLQHNYTHQQSNSFSNLRNSIQSSNQSSFDSNGAMNANFMPVSVSNSNPIYHNFQTIQSRYVNQHPGSNSRQLYGSYQQINHYQPKNRNMMRNQDVPFSESDISSISYQSRADLSQYSDWTDLKPQSQQNLHGYNSADNSIIKNMQHQQSRQQQRNNICISRRTKNNNQNGDENFFKKKKDYMISSAASYYDKKFKDQQQSSSDQDNVYKTGRLSYAQRLKEKRTSDNLRSMQMSQAKSMNKLKQSSRSNRSNNMSKYSDDSNMSKTKLPVNYLARQEFISTSSTSKSTHKTAVPN